MARPVCPYCGERGCQRVVPHTPMWLVLESSRRQYSYMTLDEMFAAHPGEWQVDTITGKCDGPSGTTARFAPQTSYFVTKLPMKGQGFRRHPLSSLTAHSLCQFDLPPERYQAQLVRDFEREEGDGVPWPDDEVVFCLWPRGTRYREPGRYERWLVDARRQASRLLQVRVSDIEAIPDDWLPEIHKMTTATLRDFLKAALEHPVKP